MASASAAAPPAGGGPPIPGVPIVARRRILPGGGTNGVVLPSGVDGAPIMHPGTYPSHCSHRRPRLVGRLVPGKLPPRLPWPDIGRLAKWSVSSFKFGFGAECLTDEDPDTFWQYVSHFLVPCSPHRLSQFGRPTTTLHHRRVPA